MSLATKEDVIRMVQRYSAAYPHTKLIPETYGVYAEALEGVPVDVLTAVFVQAVQNSEFFPTLHKIREVMTDILFQVPTAELAWEEVVRCLSLGRTIEYSDPLIQRVVNMVGGEWALQRSTNLVADRAQFLKMYANLRERMRQEVMTTPAVKQLRGTAKPEVKKLEAPVAETLVAEAEGELIGMDEGVQIMRKKLRESGKLEQAAGIIKDLFPDAKEEDVDEK
jgi:hypothetical protein